MNQKSRARSVTVSISSFRCPDAHACVCTQLVCVPTCIHIQTQVHTHTYKIYYSNLLFQMSVCTLWVMYTYLHWVQQAGSETLRGGLGKPPNCICIFHAENFWPQITALKQTNPLRRYDSLLQKTKTEDSLTGIVLTAWCSGSDANEPFRIITAKYLVPDQHQWPGVQRRREGLKTTLSCSTMDRAHPGVVHIHLLFHNTYRN